MLLTITPMIALRIRGINMALPPNPPSRYVKAIQYASLTDLLTHFRQSLERENGKPINELSEVNAAMLISDLCVFLGLSDQNRQKILGAQAAMHIDQALVTKVGPTIQH
jgi:hypothetical protein